MKIKKNVVYSYALEIRSEILLKRGGKRYLTPDKIKHMYSDGRTMSPYSEAAIEEMFKDEIIRKDTKGVDFIYKHSGPRTIECKLITKNGLDLSPSFMKGVGRKFDKKRYYASCKDKDFCITDSTNFPNMRFVFISGEDCLEKHKYSASEAKKIFFGDK